MTESARDTDDAASASLPVQDPWFEVTQLSPSLFRITEPRCHRWVRANCFLILGRDRDILVDSGMGVAALRPILDPRSSILDPLSSRPRLVFTTHAHIDHVGSHPEFTNCEILAHPAETDELARPSQQGLRFPKRNAEEVAALRASGIEPSEFMLEAVPFAGYDLESYRRAPVKPTRLISEGDVVETGDRKFQVLHLPGHSPGSIALWERSSGSLFSGDAIYDGVIVDNLRGSDVGMYRETMKRLAQLPAAQVLGGHNAPMTRTQMLDVVERYLASRP
jgi:glyoxylase-like metal-dependent hydrolase (beta-lactamase superfamily II)